MKQIQFEVKNLNNLRKELSRVKRVCKAIHSDKIFLEIFTQLMDYNEMKKITDIIDAELPEAQYHGCQTYGNIFEGHISEWETMIVCSIFEYDTTRAQLIYIDPVDSNADFQTLQDLWDFCNHNEWVKSVELISSYKGSELLGIGKPIGNLREDVVVFGGVAINPITMGVLDTYVFTKDNGYSSMAATAVVSGGEDLHVQCSCVKGWEGLGKSFAITDCEGKRVRTIDDEPAMNIYRKYLNVEQDESFADNSLLFPLLVEVDGEECIRIPLACENKDEFDLMVDVENGMEVRLSYGDKHTILHQAKSRLKEIADFGPETVRVYSCAARRMFWEDDKVSLETAIYDDIAPTIGFYTRGEIIRINNYLHYLNSTMVYVLLREGEGYAAEYHLEDVVADPKDKEGLVPKLINYIGVVTGELESQYNSTMMGMAHIYRTMFLVDVEEQTFVQLDENEKVKEILSVKEKAEDKIRHFLRSIIEPEYMYKALKFFDLSSLASRLQKKNFIDCELKGKEVGWLRAQIVVIGRDGYDKPTKYVLTTQEINDEKIKEQTLVQKTLTDELTGLLNRRAYEEGIKELRSSDIRYILASLDVNGLKVVNDELGHSAGDELIIGAAKCLKESFGAYGKVYRIGGDEFAAILYSGDERLEKLKDDLEQQVLNWHGNRIDKLSISSGFATSSEFEHMDSVEIMKIADQRMYANKQAHYSRGGNDRRQHRGSYEALCSSYLKMLKVDLTKDEYTIIRAAEDEHNKENGFEELSLSAWFKSFLDAGFVHEEDCEEFKASTDINYLREYFVNADKIYRLLYRRKTQDGYVKVLLEMIPTKEFTKEKKEVYLLVKNIDF